MKCPFLVIKKDVLNKDGNKTGEEIEPQECIKNDCMIYDGATKLCSLLSSNMKTGVLIDDVKNGIKDMKEELFQRSEAFGIVISTNIQTLQGALLGRFDILKKQNEVMVLGFDRLVETINNKFEGIRSNFSELNETTKSQRDVLLETLNGYQNSITENFNTMRETIHNQVGSLKSNGTALQSAIEEFKDTHGQFISEVKHFNEAFLIKLTEFGDFSLKNEKANDSTVAKLDILNENLGKIGAVNQVSLETINGTISKLTTMNQEVLAKLGQLDLLVNNTDGINDALKTEVVGLKVETLNALNNIAAKFEELSGAFANTMKPGIDSMTEFMRTEVAGLKTEALNALIGLSAKFDELGKVFSDELKSGSETVRGLIGDFNTISESIKTGIGELKSVLTTKFDGLGGYIVGVKTEIVNMSTNQTASLNNVQGVVLQLQELFKQSSDSLGSMSDMMKNLNSNYIESLGKIAGLAEGMRNGVDKVGKGMHDSVKDLVKEMKSEIGALEKQYEKTFGDIANLAGKFDGLNVRIKEMTKEVEKEFRDSFNRQETLSEYTKTILEHTKEHFVKEETRYKDEQEKRMKKEGLDHFDRATLYYYRGNYELAVNEINKSLEIEETAEYLNLKGLLLTELGKFNESKKIYKKALEIEPNLAEIHNNLGMLHLKMKKLDDAVVAFREAVKKNVNYSHAYVNLGSTLVELEKFDEAIKAYEMALEIDPSNHEAHEAIKLYKEGKIGE
ncbi:MAG: tetratricopeptide repeat protein [bacterium]